MVLIFLLLLAVSGATGGVISEIIYFCAFAVPVAVGLLADNKRRKEEEQHDREYPEPDSYFKLRAESVRTLVPMIFPTLALVLAVSYVTSFIIFAITGEESAVSVGDSLPIALIRHALLPAVLEEALFRFMPLRMLSRHSASATVIISSLYFALVHNSFYSIPYAFVAGLIFITVDLVCESVWPSVILHFVNNAASVVWIMYSGSDEFAFIYYGVIAALALVSLVFIVIDRKRYRDKVFKVLSYGERLGVTYEPLLVAVPTLLLAATEFV